MALQQCDVVSVDDGPRSARSVRPLLFFVCALVLVDTAFFTALTPLLPYYTHVAHLSKSGAGVLVAAIHSARWSGRSPEECSPTGSVIARSSYSDCSS